jgi:hypothetical protein
MNATINVWSEQCDYKKAICKCCGNKLKQGETIVCVSTAQGRFTSIGNYHLMCSEEILSEIAKEMGKIMNNVYQIDEKINAQKEWEKNNNKCNTEEVKSV